VEPGSVTPFAAINDVAGNVAIVLDAAMLAHEVLNYHPLVNTMTTSISRAGLMAFLRACGHEPRIEIASDAPSYPPPQAGEGKSISPLTLTGEGREGL